MYRSQFETMTMANDARAEACGVVTAHRLAREAQAQNQPATAARRSSAVAVPALRQRE